MSNRPPSFPSFPGSPVPAAPAGATGAVKVPLPGLAPAPTATPATNVIGASTSAPPAIPAPAPAAQVPSPAARGATNVPAPTPATALPSPAATLPSPAAASPTAVAPVVPPAALPPAAVPALPSPPAVPAGLPIPGAPAQAPANFQPLADQDQIIAAGLISVQGMPLDQFFDLYSQLSGRTILRPYQLPGQGITLKAQTDLTKRKRRSDGCALLNSITMIPIGEKFVKAVPSTQAMQEGALVGLTASEMPLASSLSPASSNSRPPSQASWHLCCHLQQNPLPSRRRCESNHHFARLRLECETDAGDH